MTRIAAQDRSEMVVLKSGQGWTVLEATCLMCHLLRRTRGCRSSTKVTPSEHVVLESCWKLADIGRPIAIELGLTGLGRVNFRSDFLSMV